MSAPDAENLRVGQFRHLITFLTSCNLMSDDVGMEGRKAKSAKPNQFFCGDNLEVLRRHLIPDSSVDLIYLDPPFQSGRNYNLLFHEQDGTRSPSQQEAFEDTWEWDYGARTTYEELIAMDHPVARVMESMRLVVHDSPMLAYMSMMAVRLIELHRVLKSTGSLYLHCDPTASHYLKMVLDAVFGPENFMSEVVWKRTGTHSSAKRWGPVHDVLLFYAKSLGSHVWNRPYVPMSEKHIKQHYRVDDQGRTRTLGELTAPGTRNGKSGAVWRGFDVTSLGRHWCTTVEKLDVLASKDMIYFPPDKGWPRLIRYGEPKGKAVGDVWDDIAPLNMMAKERMGYPTQKPVSLMDRIIKASSNVGDLVLDPFCGCGTTIEAAHRLQRRWIGIDITHLAEDLLRRRLNDDISINSYSSRYIPRDIESARRLATKDRVGRFEFQRWALEFFGVYSEEDEEIQGSDGGVDGELSFQEGGSRSPWKKIIFSVKSGKVSVKDVRDLFGVVNADKTAVMGVLVTLEEPTDPMHKFAVQAGEYTTTSQAIQEKFPKIQIFTVAELLDGATLRAPRAAVRKNPRPSLNPQRDLPFDKFMTG